MIASRIKSLKALSDSGLINRLYALARKEREITLKLLLHLIEMDRRELYSRMGYSSLFDFCTRQLKCSESDANRKIRAARCIRDFPEVYAVLENNELDPCQVALIDNMLSLENKSELLSKIKYKSYRQIQEIIARFNPSLLIRDKIRPVFVPRAEPIEAISKPKSEIKTDKKFTANVGGKKTSSSNTAIELEKKFKLEFAVSPNLKQEGTAGGKFGT